MCFVCVRETGMRSFPIFETESIQTHIKVKAVFLQPMVVLLWDLVSVESSLLIT